MNKVSVYRGEAVELERLLIVVLSIMFKFSPCIYLILDFTRDIARAVRWKIACFSPKYKVFRISLKFIEPLEPKKVKKRIHS